MEVFPEKYFLEGALREDVHASRGYFLSNQKTRNHENDHILKSYIFDGAASKISTFKKSYFPIVRNDENTFSEVLIFDGAAENMKN